MKNIRYIIAFFFFVVVSCCLAHAQETVLFAGQAGNTQTIRVTNGYCRLVQDIAPSGGNGTYSLKWEYSNNSTNNSWEEITAYMKSWEDSGKRIWDASGYYEDTRFRCRITSGSQTAYTNSITAYWPDGTIVMPVRAKGETISFGLSVTQAQAMAGDSRNYITYQGWASNPAGLFTMASLLNRSWEQHAYVTPNETAEAREGTIGVRAEYYTYVSAQQTVPTLGYKSL